MILHHELLTHENTAPLVLGLPHTKYIIDVGPGIIPCPLFICEKHILIEPCDEYIEHLKDWTGKGSKVEIVKGEAELLADYPRENTTVLMLDVIEHMEKDRGEKIRDLAEEFEHAVVMTPYGPCPRDGKNPDDWGLNGGYWQRHLSTWWPQDFKNWTVNFWNPFKGRITGAILAIR